MIIFRRLVVVSKKPVDFNRCRRFVAHGTIFLRGQLKEPLLLRTSSVRMSTNQETQDPVSKDDIIKRQLLQDVFKMVLSSRKVANDRSRPVVKFRTPDELEKVVGFDVADKAVDSGTLKKYCELVFEYAVHTDHPRFFNQQFGGADEYGLAGDIVVAANNCNSHTFEVAPLFIMTEKAVIKKTLRLIGYEHGEGTFCPGGTYSSMLATNLARHRIRPDAKSKGILGMPQLVMFASKQAHYSAKKNAELLGIGNDNCIEVACDENGKMIPSELEKEMVKAKSAGAVPFFAVATAGTTVLGAFDDFNAVADICERHGVWMHVDGCWGGSAMMSKKHKHLLNGVERSDSFAWNPHKLMMMPIQCSMFLVKQERLMNEAHGCEVPYLFQPKKPYDEVQYDVSRDLIQCGRRADSFKLWLAWKAHGDDGFEKQVDQAFDNSAYLLEQIKKREHFKLVIEKPQMTNISFWYFPPSLRNQKQDDEFWKKMHEVPAIIKERMQRSGTVMCGYQPLGSLVNFFRMVNINNNATHEDMDFVLDEIERLGADL